MLSRQLFDDESSTYTYLLADEKSHEAVLIDPVLEQVNRDLEIVNDLGLTLVHVLGSRPRVIDVRETSEYTGGLGHIPGAESVPLATLEAVSLSHIRSEIRS